MLKIKKVSEVLGRYVYTDAGDFLGEVEEANLANNKIDGWRIKMANKSSMAIGGARGIIVPHNFVKAVGDVFIISRASLPIREEMDLDEAKVETIEEA